MINEVNWRNGFVIGAVNTKTVPMNVKIFRIMRKASLFTPLRQRFLSSGSSYIQNNNFFLR